ncbi:MAG TPA: hypothetical protein PLH98_11545 [Ruminococcus flavefaciens]|nr:hypothetical protein [Ruminococcus flavefaciens]
MKYIPAAALLVAVVIALNPVYAPAWFWLAWFGFCPALMLALDPEDFKEFFGLNEKPRRNGTNR